MTQLSWGHLGTSAKLLEPRQEVGTCSEPCRAKNTPVPMGSGQGLVPRGGAVGSAATPGDLWWHRAEAAACLWGGNGPKTGRAVPQPYSSGTGQSLPASRSGYGVTGVTHIPVRPHPRVPTSSCP